MLITAAKQLRLPVIAALLCTSGCTASKTMHTQTVPDADYHAALEWSDPLWMANSVHSPPDTE